MSRQREWQKQQNAEGKCARCGKALEPERKTHCTACVEKQRVAQKAKADAARDAGLCIVCKAAPIVKRLRCEKHVIALRAAERRRFINTPRRTQTRVDGMNACGRCGGRGHNRATCEHVIDADETTTAATPNPHQKAS